MYKLKFSVFIYCHCRGKFINPEIKIKAEGKKNEFIHFQTTMSNILPNAVALSN